MIYFSSINIVLVFMMVIMIGCASNIQIPDVKFEVLKNGSFRAYMPDTSLVDGHFLPPSIPTDLLPLDIDFRSLPIQGNIRMSPENNAKIAERSFAIHIYVNKLQINDQPPLICYSFKRHNGYFVVESDKKLKMGDYLYYTIEMPPFYVHPGVVYYSTVTELLDSYNRTSEAPAERCEETLFYDNFKGNEINLEKWIVEHRIPTYTGPRFLFNSYVNTPETAFIGLNHFLNLKPIALTNENDVRGTLNLGSSCTSCISEECIYNQLSTFLLPPIKSAMVRSRRKFRYGKFEVFAKLPVGDWIFPIIQLARPTKDKQSVDEIWIVYSKGNEIYMGENVGSERSLFAGPVKSADEPLRSSNLITHKFQYKHDFNVFRLNWYPDKFQFFLNSVLIGEVNSSQFNSFGASESDLEYELFIGVGVGGLIDFPDGDEKPWINTERNYMKKFFEDRNNWLRTWSDDDIALQISYVKVTAL